ncbi:MAG TPA: sigma-54 dependent transcriptional regulator [Candidatus Binatia bacterium]|nr:sigma-54 dependent transcriptional regulator [Candidatus Binatia bacterium]
MQRADAERQPTDATSAIFPAVAQPSRADERAAARGASALVGASEAMARLRSAIRRCAGSPACVLVEGETGAGKELVARALHEESPRAVGPFVPVNCGALPEQLVESELFGHVRGAFTGAHRDHPGLVEAARRGTLFLDEVEDLTAPLQGKLLRLLQEAECRPLGAVRPRTADVRVVAASNADLADLVAARRFRPDLFYRLNVLRIAVPPLRRRPEDVPVLVAHFVARVAARGTGVAGARAPREPGRDAIALLLPSPSQIAWLQSYAWPGNVRELANLVERALVFRGGAAAEGWQAAIEELVAPGRGGVAAAPGAASPPPTNGPPSSRGATRPALDPEGPADATGVRARDPSDARSALCQVLDRHRWRREAAARELGISRVTLWRRMRRLGLVGAEPDTAAASERAADARVPA